MRLNLGCGNKKIAGFLNIDNNPEVFPDRLQDVSNLCFIYNVFPNEQITEIVAYDIIEHFDRVQIPTVLKNWYDHLAAGGILYIRTNDLDRMIDLYKSGSPAFPADKFIWHLMCEHEKPGMGHKWCFTKQTLFRALVTAGFKKITVTPPRKVAVGDYPYSFTKNDFCNVHMTAVKI
jgi:predicted SAM-dependent methyltransferase